MIIIFFHPNICVSTSIPSVIGKPLPTAKLLTKPLYCGEAATKISADSLEHHWPIDGGLITDWDAMQKLWDHLLSNELRVDPQEYSVLISEPPHAPKPQREKVAQIMFESYSGKQHTNKITI
jgi:actin-related protein